MSRRRSTVDDVIESGEIVERRSLVVRSQSLPAVDWNDEPTALVTPALATLSARRGRMGWLVAAAAAGITAVALMVIAKTGGTDTGALDADAEMIGTTLDAEARAALLKVEAIAASPVLRAGIETDAGTLADMARDHDLVFPLRPGDVVEVFQIRNATRTLMLRLPAGAPALAPPAVGSTRIAAHGSGIVAVANAAITTPGAGIAGEVVLATPVDLAVLAKPISGHARSARLEGLGDPIVLVDGRAAANVSLPIVTKSPVGGSLALAAAVPQPTVARNLAWACLALSLLLFAMFAVSVARARPLRVG